MFGAAYRSFEEGKTGVYGKLWNKLFEVEMA
jgi:hypothetical protein